YYYNPTAYKPWGVFETPITDDTSTASKIVNLNQDYGLWAESDHMPECANNRWACPNSEAVVVSMRRSQGDKTDPFTGNPKEIAAQYKQDKENALPPGQKESSDDWG